MNPVVVDTNVLEVANEAAPQADPACVRACIDGLEAIKNHGRIVIDRAGLIFAEYQKHCSFSGQPGIGDDFFRWLFDNQAVFEHCEQVDLTPLPGRPNDFAEFPDDPALATFDRSDRKFVAIVRASPSHPVILNAVDSDWRDHRESLQRHGVFVEELCLHCLKKR